MPKAKFPERQTERYGTISMARVREYHMGRWIGAGALLLLLSWGVVVAKAPQATPPNQVAKAGKAKAKARWQAMLPMLRHKDVKKRKEAFLALQSLAPQHQLPWKVLQQALADRDWSLREAAVQRLSQQPIATLRAKVWQRAIEASVKDEHWRVRVAALEVLKRRGQPASSLALRAVQDPHERVRERGISLLGLSKTLSPPMQSAILKALADNKWQVRAAAAWVLRQHQPNPRALREALARRLNDAEPTVRLVAMQTLARAGQVAIPLLLGATRAKTPETRALAIQALTHRPTATPQVLQRLQELLGDPQAKVRETAGAALGSLGPKASQAAKALIKCFDDRHHGVQSIAVWALGRMGASVAPILARTLLHTKEAFKTGAAKALSAMGPAAAPATPFLVDALLDKRWRVREEVTWALYRIGPKAKHFLPSSMMPIVINALQDRSWKIRFGLIKLIGHIGPQARIVIGWFGPTTVSTLGLLRKLCLDPHPHVRRAAKATLRSLESP